MLKEGQKHGYGEFIWPDGRVYKGEWVNDLREGHGLFRWASKSAVPESALSKTSKSETLSFSGKIFCQYEGGWKNGKQHGMGVYTNGEGITRKGEWVEGKRTRWIDESPLGNEFANTNNQTGELYDSRFPTEE